MAQRGRSAVNKKKVRQDLRRARGQSRGAGTGPPPRAGRGGMYGNRSFPGGGMVGGMGPSTIGGYLL